MNRNTNAHFAELPNVEIKRSVFDRSFSHKLSGNVGNLIPIFYDDILPGDTVSMDTSKIIRFQTLLTPFMDQMYCDVYWFFVPNRLVWDHWINFMGENTQSAWVSSTEYTVPQLAVYPQSQDATRNETSNARVGTILDYLGFPVGSPGFENGADLTGVKINALPVRGYAKICNDWFRDENLMTPLNIYTGDATKTAKKESAVVNDVPQGGNPFICAKFADYFTSCLPSPQKGSPVSFNLNGKAPVLPETTMVPVIPPHIPMISFNQAADPDYNWFNVRSDDVESVSWLGGGGATFDAAVSNWNTAANSILPVNLWADLSRVNSQLFNINDIRMAFQLQRLLERDARGGTRYIEVIKSHFNVDSPDQRLQRSEYLGGNRFAITVNQVSNTAQSQQDFLGDLGAFSVTADSHSDFTKSFTEHGMLFGLMVVRYDHTYSQGLEKFWQRESRFDYYWPVFANIGEQPVNKSEIYLTNEASKSSTFGYNEAYADYRFKPNRVSGEMRPYVSNGLFSWTLADSYSSAPSLSFGWIHEDKANVDRVLSVTSSNAHQFWADFYFNFKHTRPMPVYSVPGLIDHN